MGANIIDLTTVAAVNAILSQGSAIDSAIIQAEITAYSQNILTRTGRGFLSGVRAYSERYNGNGSYELPVRNYPILSIQSVMVNGIAIPATPDYRKSGYVIDTEGSICNIALISGGAGDGSGYPDDRWGVRPGGWGSYGNAPPLGYSPYRFSQGIQNVAVAYTAGYTIGVPAEVQTVPATPGPYTVTVANAATFYADNGVMLANGTPLVSSGASAPSPGQYQPPQAGVLPAGVYTFNAAQQAASVLLAYAYGAAPFDLQEACGRLVAEMYRKRSWIGQSSQVQPSVGTTAYSRLEVEIGTAMTIERYKMRFLS
jgi:hypothetical protein